MLADGGGFCDAVLFAHAHRAVADGDDKALRAVAELAAALAPSQGAPSGDHRAGHAFLEATRCGLADAGARPARRRSGTARSPIRWRWRSPPPATASRSSRRSPPSCRRVAANLGLAPACGSIPLGQTDGQRVLAALEPVVAATAQRALAATLDDIGGAAFRADLASVRHETQYTRLFRS